MIRALLPFLIPVVFLMQVVAGLMRLGWPHRQLKELKISRLKKEGQTGSASDLKARPARALVEPSDAPQLRRIRWHGLLRLGIGIIGVGFTGLTLGWVKSKPLTATPPGASELNVILEKHARAFLEKGGGLSLAVAAVQGTNQTILTLGPRSLGGPALEPDTLFEIGSISKTFTGLALARSMERGTLAADQPVQTLLPPGIDLPADAQAITLEHLATHTSGFPRLPGNMSFARGLFASLGGGNPYAGFGEPSFFEALESLRLEAKPGAQMSYSNFGTGLLGYVLARHQGKDWASMVRDEICRPLGMNDTAARLSDDQSTRFARGYRALLRLGPVAVALKSDPWDLVDPLAGAGALRSTPRDMLRYLAANMNPEGSELASALREAQRVRHRDNNHTAVGLNWLRTRPGKEGPEIIWHNGGTGGFRSFLGFTEDGRAGVVVLSNVSRSVDGLGQAILRDLMK